MKYRIVLEKPAEKFIVKLPQPEKKRVLRAISKLPYEGDIKRLQGKKSRGLLHLCVGDYRVIYTIDDGLLVVCVIDAGNRGRSIKDIHKKPCGARTGFSRSFFQQNLTRGRFTSPNDKIFSGIHRALLRSNAFQGNE